MAITVELSADCSFIAIVGSGLVDDEQYARAAQDAEAIMRRVGPVPHMLSDWTAVERLDLSSASVRESARAVRESAHAGAVAQRKAIVARADATYGVARMWQSLVEGSGIDCRVFRLRDEAVNWLLMGEPEPEPAGGWDTPPGGPSGSSSGRV